MTNITRMMVESVSKYSAAPPQIPQILLSYNDFVSRFFISVYFFFFPARSMRCIVVRCRLLSIYSFVYYSAEEGCQTQREQSPQFAEVSLLSYVPVWLRVAPKEVSFLGTVMTFVEMNAAVSRTATEVIGRGVLLPCMAHHGIV